MSALQVSINDQSYAPQRIFCIGKNYDEHVKELGGQTPEEPVVFMKPVSSIVAPGETLLMPRHGNLLHHEVEVVLLIGREGQDIPEADALSYIAGVTLGLDLTLRDVQGRLKKTGLPWELSKSFEQSAPLGDFKAYDSNSIDLENFSFICSVNGDLRQQGNTCDMLFPVRSLISTLSRWWTLRPGDIIYTGTPAGVGPLDSGDVVVIESPVTGSFSWTLARD
ncbi:MAG: fumarylacetoacetate hydrolase family protein [Nitrospinae bacterium]|nr:fumarylacetoacetate hydrolase family protein [Nitrospinota bacterium]MBL7021212.1 fumarylacetoacetate hydrolase family protein [Nitrospinaceae bacterium]